MKIVASLAGQNKVKGKSEQRYRKKSWNQGDAMQLLKETDTMKPLPVGFSLMVIHKLIEMCSYKV